VSTFGRDIEEYVDADGIAYSEIWSTVAIEVADCDTPAGIYQAYWSLEGSVAVAEQQ
jgi:hypothetical protein